MEDEYDRNRNNCCDQCSVHYDAPDGKDTICANFDCDCHKVIKPKEALRERIKQYPTWPHR